MYQESKKKFKLISFNILQMQQAEWLISTE